LLREEFRLLKLILHSELRRRAASRRALPCPSSCLWINYWYWLHWLRGRGDWRKVKLRRRNTLPAHSVSVKIYGGIARFPCDSTTLFGSRMQLHLCMCDNRCRRDRWWHHVTRQLVASSLKYECAWCVGMKDSAPSRPRTPFSRPVASWFRPSCCRVVLLVVRVISTAAVLLDVRARNTLVPCGAAEKLGILSYAHNLTNCPK